MLIRGSPCQHSNGAGELVSGRMRLAAGGYARARYKSADMYSMAGWLALAGLHHRLLNLVSWQA